jgi:hypothetical protein
MPMKERKTWFGELLLGELGDADHADVVLHPHPLVLLGIEQILGVVHAPSSSSPADRRSGIVDALASDRAPGPLCQRFSRR